MGTLQPLHLMLIALAVLLVFGPRKLPELARGVGESMRELKSSLQGAARTEEATLAHEIGQTVTEIQIAASPLVPPAGSLESVTAPRA